MGVIAEIIRHEQSGGISFGNYLAKEKQKVGDFDVNGDIYKVKTHNEITRLEKNSKLLLEAVPGCTIHDFHLSDTLAIFSAEGYEDTGITLELEPEKDYRIVIDGMNVGDSKSNRSGKLSFSVELGATPKEIKVEKF
jgi:hypothetical protein